MMRPEKSILALVPAAMLAGVTHAVPDACDAHSVHACAPAGPGKTVGQNLLS